MLRSRLIGAFGIGATLSCIISCGTNVELPSSTSSAMGGSGGHGGDTTSGGNGGGGTSFCANSMPVDFGSSLDGDLAVTGQEDVYRFKGKKGQVVRLDIDAQLLGKASYDPTYIDTVVTLFDDLGNQIAQNNDPLGFSTGDSRLDTILPADGEYCAKVSECWTTIANPAMNCAGQKDKLVTKYQLWVYEYVDQQADGETAEFEPDDTPATAIPIEYRDLGGKDYMATFWGTFKKQSDVDVFRFVLPNDVTLPANTRAAGWFYFLPGGTNESGSTATMGNVWVTDANAPDQILALGDAAAHARFAPRLELGKPYLLFVERPSSADRPNDFYFVRHFPEPSNSLETETSMGANDMPDKAEPIAIDNVTLRGYFEGDLKTAPMDVDHFVANVPSGATTVRVTCGAQVDGSGLRDMKISLLAADGSALSAMASATEGKSFAQIAPVPVGNNTQVIVQVKAGHQELTIAESFYACGIRF